MLNAHVPAMFAR